MRLELRQKKGVVTGGPLARQMDQCLVYLYRGAYSDAAVISDLGASLLEPEDSDVARTSGVGVGAGVGAVSRE